MPLSEYEQRVLDELERDLGTDPKLTSAMARPRRSTSRLLGAGLGVFVGLGVVLAGVMAQVAVVGILGFAIMTGAALWAISGGRSAKGQASRKKGGGPGKSGRQGFITRLEERFERRRETGDL